MDSIYERWQGLDDMNDADIALLPVVVKMSSLSVVECAEEVRFMCRY